MNVKKGMHDAVTSNVMIIQKTVPSLSLAYVLMDTRINEMTKHMGFFCE